MSNKDWKDERIKVFDELIKDGILPPQEDREEVNK